MTVSFARTLGILLVGGSLLTSCAGSRFRPQADRPERPVLTRGWAYAESEREMLSLDAGVTPVSYAGPVVAAERVVAGSDRFGVMAFGKRNGEVLWRRNFPEEVAAQPFVHAGGVYVGTVLGGLHFLDLRTGAQKWEVGLGSPVQGEFLHAFDRLYVSTADGAVHALDPGTGKTIWSYRRAALGGTTIRGGGRPAAIGGRVWMGFGDGALVSLDPQSGAMLSEKLFRDNLKFLDLDAKVVGWRDGLFVATYDGKLRYLRADGSVVWEFAAGGARTPLVSETEIVYLPASDGTVYALRATTGKELWRYSLPRGVPTGLALIARPGKAGAALVVAGSEEWVTALDAASGRLLGRISVGRGSGTYAPLAVDGTSFYMLSAYSRLYQFRLN